MRTRRYAGENATDADNNAKLLTELAELGAVAPESRGARYVCALALALPADAGTRAARGAARRSPRLIVRRGTVRGRIAFDLRGSGGFGYDPLFEPEGEQPGGRTFGQWTAAEKNWISHRARAARRMARVLVELGF